MKIPFGVKLALTGLSFVVVSGCSGLGEDSSPAPEQAQAVQNVRTPTLSAAQVEAVQACVPEKDRAAYQPSDHIEQRLLDACKATGRQLFNALPEQVRGKPEVGSSPANAATALERATALPDATYLVRLLAVAKTTADGGEISDRVALADQIRAFLPNATKQDVLLGSQGPTAVQLSSNQNTARGSNDFLEGDDQFESTAEIAAFFASSTPKAKAAKDHVTKAIKDAGLSDAEVARALNGKGYLPLQLKEASQVLGTSYFMDGKALVLGEWRQSKPGDVYWIFVSSDEKLVPAATLRGKCANPNAQVIRIVKPGIPSAPDVTQPPTPVERCTKNCAPPPPECQRNCDHIPPGCQHNCNPPECEHGCTTTEQKIPSQGSGPQGHAPVGSGRNEDPGPGVRQAYNPPPTQQYHAPPAPAPRPGPPAGSTPTSTAPPPPPEEGANPGDGGGNSGDPGPGGDW